MVENTFESQLEKSRPKLLRFAYAIVRNPNDAEDLLQETYINAWLKQESFRHESSLDTWLCRILTNKMFDHNRLKKNQQSEPLDQLPELYVASDPLTQQINRDEWHYLLYTQSEKGWPIVEEIYNKINIDQKLSRNRYGLGLHILELHSVLGYTFLEIQEKGIKSPKILAYHTRHLARHILEGRTS